MEKLFPELEKTSLWQALSPLGQSIVTPQGIFYWSGRAKQEAEIDGTIGVAQNDDGKISHLSVAEEYAGAAVMAKAPDGAVFGYAPIPGRPSLRKKWLESILKTAPALAPFATLPVVTNGITHGLALATRLVLAPGDTLITAEKSWANYHQIFVDLQGLKMASFTLFNDEGGLNVESLIESCKAAAEHSKKVALLLNFPHNQTGFTPSEDDVKKLGAHLRELALERPDISFVIILDDAYEGYVYDEKGLKQTMLPHVFVQAPNVTFIKLDGISKGLLAYGYRIGFITVFLNNVAGGAPQTEAHPQLDEEVTSKIGGMIRGEISQVSHHGQILTEALLERWDEVVSERGEVIAMLQDRWEEMQRAFV
ncbi:hypothetical protein CO046_03910, partial [Candidatus Peregrinibacteria bacterium CG_4_9_14_0_2_um_filter_53_11]